MEISQYQLLLPEDSFYFNADDITCVCVSVIMYVAVLVGQKSGVLADGTSNILIHRLRRQLCHIGPVIQ